MKIVIFMLLLFVSLTAYTLPSSKEINQNAKEVSQRGWKFAKPPLKQFIKKDGDDFINEFLKKANNPFNSPVVKNGIPKILLTKVDYYYALSYLKYLESKREGGESFKNLF